jgi:hypothetical protein
MRYVIFAMVVAVALQASGQVPQEEAAAKLKARQEEKRLAASQPVTISKGELDALRQEIADLRRRLIAAGDEISALKRRLASSSTKPAGGGAAANAAPNAADNDGPGLYRFTWTESGSKDVDPRFAGPNIQNSYDVKANSREIACDIARRSKVPLHVSYDANGNEKVTNCKKVRALTAQEQAE